MGGRGGDRRRGPASEEALEGDSEDEDGYDGMKAEPDGGRYLGVAGPMAIQQAQHATRASPVTVQWLLDNYETAEGTI